MPDFDNRDGAVAASIAHYLAQRGDSDPRWGRRSGAQACLPRCVRPDTSLQNFHDQYIEPWRRNPTAFLQMPPLLQLITDDIKIDVDSISYLQTPSTGDSQARPCVGLFVMPKARPDVTQTYAGNGIYSTTTMGTDARRSYFCANATRPSGIIAECVTRLLTSRRTNPWLRSQTRGCRLV